MPKYMLKENIEAHQFDGTKESAEKIDDFVNRVSGGIYHAEIETFDDGELMIVIGDEKQGIAIYSGDFVMSVGSEVSSVSAEWLSSNCVEVSE